MLLDGCVLILLPHWEHRFELSFYAPSRVTLKMALFTASSLPPLLSNFFHGLRRLDEMGSTDMYPGVRHPSHSRWWQLFAELCQVRQRWKLLRSRIYLLGNLSLTISENSAGLATFLALRSNFIHSFDGKRGLAGRFCSAKSCWSKRFALRNFYLAHTHARF